MHAFSCLPLDLSVEAELFAESEQNRQLVLGNFKTLPARLAYTVNQSPYTIEGPLRRQIQVPWQFQYGLTVERYSTTATIVGLALSENGFDTPIEMTVEAMLLDSTRGQASSQPLPRYRDYEAPPAVQQLFFVITPDDGNQPNIILSQFDPMSALECSGDIHLDPTPAEIERVVACVNTIGTECYDRWKQE